MRYVLRNRPILFFLLVSLCLLDCTLARAQEYRGSLSGTITDPTGAAIPGAKVTVRNTATNTAVTVGTSVEGLYSVLSLDPGIYTVTVEAAGFKQLVRDNIEIRAGIRLGLDLPMEVGNVSQTVTVSSESPLLITDSGSGGQVLNTDLVGSLPLLGNNVLTLISSTSGNSHVSAFPDHRSERPFDNGGMDGYSINGGPAGGNNNSYLIDGAPNNNNEGAGFVPPVDAVSEVNVMTNEYDAEYGRTGGGITSVALKTGTNAYHGVAFWNVRNNHLNGTLHQLAKQQVTQWSEPGFQVGGPVRVPGYDGRNKTFFSASFEHIFDKEPNSVTRVYPSASQLAGNFCGGAPGNGGAGVTIYDPTTNPRQPIDTGAAVTCASLGEGTGSVIPANRIDPVMKAILSNIPAPNIGACQNARSGGSCAGGNFTLPNVIGDKYHAVTVRIDQNLTNSEKIFASYEDGNFLEFIGNPGGPAGLFPYTNSVRINHGATFNLTSVISPTFLSTAKVNWLRHNGLGRILPQGSSPASLGLSSSLSPLFGANNFPGIGFNALVPGPTNPGSAISYSGLSQGGQNSTTLSDNWTAQETLSKVTGAHSLKFGGLITITTVHQQQASQIPTINFSDVFTRLNPNSNSQTGGANGDAIATALLGYPTSISYTTPFRGAYGTRYFAVFAQDDWRVSKSLTLNLGLRWDAQTPPHERYNRANVNFNPALASIGAGSNPLGSNCAPSSTTPLACPANGLGGGYLGGLVFASPDTTRSPFASDFQNYGLRFGAAYQISQKLVVRGGWGRFYDYAGAYNFPPAFGYAPTSTIVPSSDGNYQFPTLCGTTGPGNFGCPAANPLAGLSTNGYANIFLTGLNPVTGSSLGPRTGVGTAITFMDPNFKPDYVNQFNIGFDYQLPSQMLFHIEYNGSRSRNVPLVTPGGFAGVQNVSKNLNFVSASQYLTLGTALTTKVANPFAGLLPGTALNGAQVSEQQMLQPFPQYLSVSETNLSAGRLKYDSLQTRLEKRMTHGLTVVGNFTWSKNLGQNYLLNPNFDSLTNVFRAPVNIDQPYLFNVVMTYKLPLFNSSGRFVSGILGGWSMSGTAQFQSGSEIAAPSSSSNVKWTGLDPTKVIPGVWTGQTMNRWFNNCVINSAGTAIANAGSGPSNCPASTPLSDAPWQLTPNQFFLNNIPPYFEHIRTQRHPVASLAFFKSFSITERVKFLIRADAYNLTNTPWFGFGDNGAGINTSATNSAFGTVNGNQGNDPRTLQLSGRLSF